VLAQLGTATDPQVARSVVLRIINQNQIFLLVGAAIITVGLLAGGFALLRRRLDPLLLWFAAFAGLYGTFLVFEYQPLWNLGVQAPILSRIALAVGLLVPVPAFFFFDGLNLLGKVGRFLRNAIWPITVALAILTLALGYNVYIDRVNNVAVLAALLVLAIALLRVRQSDRDVSTTTLSVCSRTTSTSSLSPLWCYSLVSAQSQGVELWLKNRNSAIFRANLKSLVAFSSRFFHRPFRILPAFV
jgi:hypothetical protein